MSECQLCIPNLVVIIRHGINIRKRTCSIMLNTLKSSTILTFDHYLLEIAYYQGIAAKGIGCFKSKPIWPIRIRELADLVCSEPLLQAEWSFRAGWPLCLQEQRDHCAGFGLSTTPTAQPSQTYIPEWSNTRSYLPFLPFISHHSRAEKRSRKCKTLARKLLPKDLSDLLLWLLLAMKGWQD